jgi:hypothetical protein
MNRIIKRGGEKHHAKKITTCRVYSGIYGVSAISRVSSQAHFDQQPLSPQIPEHSKNSTFPPSPSPSLVGHTNRHVAKTHNSHHTALFLSPFLSTYLFYTQNHTHRARQTPHALSPANSTLGFGAIIAVSHARSPRRPGLLWAANLTDLEIEISEQAEWTVGEVEEFKAKEGSSISTGSAKAWMGHLHALKWYIALQTTHQSRRKYG